MDNGGAAWTVALLPGSPAIDAGDDSAAPPVDQRGVPRPAGPASDIGAYELGLPGILITPASQSAEFESTAVFSVVVVGYPPVKYEWFFNATNALVGATNATLQLTNLLLSQAGDYSVVITNAYGAVTSPPAILYVADPGTSLVGFPTQEALQTALAAPGRVVFLGDFTITLTNTITIATNTVLDGTGHQVVISGGNAVPVFYVSSNVTFSVANLTIANGLGTNGGSAILNDGGTVILLNTVVQSNGVLAATSPRGTTLAEGGAILNRGGSLGATNCAFFGNTAIGETFVFEDLCRGGALANEGGLANLENCIFAGNCSEFTSLFYSSLYVHEACGGAIYNAGTLNASHCTFYKNSALGAPADGGAVCNFGVLAVSGSSFVSNTVTGEPGSSNLGGGAGCPGNGGALFNAGVARLADSSFVWNQGFGGAGEVCGWHWDQWGRPQPGGGGAGGCGFGAICDIAGSCYLTKAA